MGASGGGGEGMTLPAVLSPAVTPEHPQQCWEKKSRGPATSKACALPLKSHSWPYIKSFNY